MRLAELAGRRVAVWGGGREGRAALAAIRRRLPDLRCTVFCRAEEAPLLVAQDERVRVITTPPDAATLAQFDVVIKSPGISPYRPPLAEAQAAGVRFTSGTAIWFAERGSEHVIAITGTKGKSTTAALIAHLARALGVRTALAGNIGLPLLDLVDAEAALWVVELSSFQTGDAGAVSVGVVTNLYEEHLDWHGTRECYFADKLALGSVARILLVNATQAELVQRTANHPRRVFFGEARGWQVRDDGFYREGEYIASASSLALPGIHNRLNACAALAALELAGWLPDAAARRTAAAALPTFRGLPHRLQRLGERDARVWIDDSISTTPAATLAAIESLAGRSLTVIVGGHDRGVDWSAFAASIAARTAVRIITQGSSGPRIARSLREHGMAVHEVDDLAAAVARARTLGAPGDVVLLSPGAPSFDQFRDYVARGRAFATLAGFDPATSGEILGLGVG
jgi:UDP-N-acetylmuramoylalanine--D-glutamate ligase